MMQMYKEAVEEDDTNEMHVEVEEGWKLLLKKGGDARRYRDALLKDKCAYLVEGAIAEFGLWHGVCRNALSSYVQGFLYRRLYEGDGKDPYYTSEDVESDDGEEREDEIDDERPDYMRRSTSMTIIVGTINDEEEEEIIEGSESDEDLTDDSSDE
jgi:hypothetical protein